jgi:uncharacterized Fe-S cluster-containing radical SAM superfamily protein
MATSSALQKARNPKTRFNWRVSDVVRRVKSIWLETKARFSGRGFYCSALTGDSDYNLTINSDLTVSCNCQDYDGSGHLGDLRKNSFEEVFFGPVSQKFQDELAGGKIPIPTCVRCGDLRRLAKGQKTPPPAHLPHRGILLENTVICNVDCIGCARENASDLRAGKIMPLTELSRMADLTARLGMEQIFYLNLGEPFLSPNVCKELPLLRGKNPASRIVVSTNGVLLNTDAKREAALNLSHILFSVHGISNAMSEKYMLGGDFEKAYAAMKAMVEYRNARGLREPILEWKYLLFNWNDHPKHIAQAIEMAKAIGIDIISFWPTNNPFYGISWRYRFGQFKNIGVASWKGREVDFRQKPTVVAN